MTLQKLVFCGILCALSASAQNSAVFPAALSTDGDLLIATNQARTVLSAAINDSTLSITVSDASEFTAPGVFVVGTELVKYCSIATNTFTVCSGGRGFDLTTAAAHANGQGVEGVAAAWHHNQLAAEIIAIETELGISIGNVYDLRTDQNIGAHFVEIPEIAVPSNPASGTRRLFVNSANGQLSVRTSAGQTVSLEAAAAGGGIDCSSPTELTIASGVITVTGDACFTVDTEADAASDPLTTINCTAGDRFILTAEDTTRTVVITDGTPIDIQVDFSLDHIKDVWHGLCFATNVVVELGRTNSGT